MQFYVDRRSRKLKTGNKNHIADIKYNKRAKPFAKLCIEKIRDLFKKWQNKLSVTILLIFTFPMIQFLNNNRHFSIKTRK